MTVTDKTNGLPGARERKCIVTQFAAFVNLRWRRDVKAWLFLNQLCIRLGFVRAVDANANARRTTIDTSADVRKDFCGTSAAMTIAHTAGKPTTKLRFPAAAATLCPTARFYVSRATK
jgi:hypothetical protein